MGRRDISTVYLQTTFSARRRRRRYQTSSGAARRLTASMTTISSPIVAIFEAEMFARASANTRANAATWPVASGPQAVTTRCASFAARRGAGPAGTSL